MIDFLGGRKFVIGLLVIGIGLSVDLLFVKGLTSNAMQLLIFVAGGFFIGNGAITVAGILKGEEQQPGDYGVEPIPQESVYLSSQVDELSSQLLDIKKQQSLLMEAISAQSTAIHSMMVAAGLIKPVSK